MAKTAEKTGQEVTAPPQAGVPALTQDADLEAYAGVGNENVRPEDLATPFLMLLQSNSPEVKKTDGRYVPGAEEGMFIHSLTKRLYDGKAGLDVIDCLFEPLYIKWKPRDKNGGGGGFHGAFEPGDPKLKALLAQAKPKPERELTLVLPDGDELNNTNQHYLLIRAPGQNDWEPVVLGLSSTQIKKSRNLNALIANKKITTAGGTRQAPRFATVWKLTTVAETGGGNSWWGVHLADQRRVTKPELDLAVAFNQALQEGARRARPSDETLAREDAPGPYQGGQSTTYAGTAAPGDHRSKPPPY